jgi:hypothetical protein
MDSTTIIGMLQSVIDAVRGTGGGEVTSLVAPPGFVYVNPTGPEGADKARLWPTPHPEKGEMLLGYATRCMNTVDPVTNLPIYPRGQYGMILQGAAKGNPNFAEALDRIRYPRDWMTQADLDMAAALAARDAGAKWISDPPADSSVPIDGQ